MNIEGSAWDSSPLLSDAGHDQRPGVFEDTGHEQRAGMFEDEEHDQLIPVPKSLPGEEELGDQFEELLTKTGGFGRCKIPLTNLSREYEQALLPMDLDDHKPFHSKCKMFDLNYTKALEDHGDDILQLIAYVNHSRSSLNLTECTHGWVYDRSIMDSSLIMEFGLVCGASFLPTLVYLLSSVGGSLGIPVGGYMSDHFGRKRSFFVFFLFYIIFGIGSCFAPTFVAFVVVICIQSLATNPSYIIPYMVGIELLGSETRSTFSVLLTVFFTLGGVAFTGVAYMVRNWRVLLFASTAPFALFMAYWFVMPESPRWLLSMGKFSTVEKFLKRVAKVNGKPFDTECEEKYHRLRESYAEIQNRPAQKLKKRSWLDLMRTPNLRRKTILLTYLSCNVNLVYTGLNYYAPSLGNDPYLSFLLVSLVELPGSLFTQIIADRLGRRLTMVICFVFGSTACIATVVVPGHWTMLSLFLVAKLFITSAYTVQELIVYEMYPTVIRGEGVALTNIVGYLLSNLGPVIVFLRFNNASFPMLVFGGLSVVGIFCILALPETLHSSLPETVQEAENFGNNMTIKDIFRFWPPSKLEVSARSKHALPRDPP